MLVACFSQTSPEGKMHLERQNLQEVDSPTVWETFRCQVSHQVPLEGYIFVFLLKVDLRMHTVQQQCVPSLFQNYQSVIKDVSGFLIGPDIKPAGASHDQMSIVIVSCFK